LPKEFEEKSQKKGKNKGRKQAVRLGAPLALAKVRGKKEKQTGKDTKNSRAK